ncbi:hypothetical protein AX17_001505 [Amanita inopinata Kibby_2008]|nr:hypothetical protein AX17_001505 [Amanita inopinata Kibby_2008]
MNKFFATAIALVSLVPGIVSLMVNTPASLVQCQPTKITWADGEPPYYLSILPGGQVAAAPLKMFGPQTGNSYTWVADMPPNQPITIALKDSTGDSAYTDQVLIQPSNDQSCMNGGAPAASAADSSASAGGTPAADASKAPDASAAAPATTQAAAESAARTTAQAAQGSNRASSAGSQSVASKSAARASAAASATQTNGASRFVNAGAYGVAGLAGFLGVALF